MLQKLQNSRVHIICLGFNSKWIIDSFQKSRPDKVYLIKNKDEHENASNAKKEILKFLKKKDIGLEIVETQGDIYPLIKNLGEIIKKEKRNFIYLGISSGQRDNISAFILSSMLFNKSAKGIYLYSMRDGKFVTLPSFEAKLPEKEIIIALKFLEANGECTKKNLMTFMFKEKHLKVDKDTTHNKYMKLNRKVIDKLFQWKFIEMDKNVKGGLITLTEEGKNWSKIF